MTTAQYLAQYGIAESNLSPTVKDGINEVLRKAGTEALTQLSKVLSEKSRALGLPGDTTDSDAIKAAQEAAAAEALAAQQAADEAASKKKLLYIMLAVVGAVLAGVGAYIIIKRRKQHGRQQ